MMNFVKGSISIRADLAIIQEVLVEYRYIEEWEKGFDSFKELHVSEGMKTIVHWDIEFDIDFIFSVTENEGVVLLELTVGDLSKLSGKKCNSEEMRYYIDIVLCRIKAMSERLHVPSRQVQSTSETK